MTYLPHPCRVKLCKMAQEWRPKAKHIDSKEMHQRLSDIVWETITDKNGREHPVYLKEFQRAAIVSYAYCLDPTAHDMHRV